MLRGERVKAVGCARLVGDVDRCSKPLCRGATNVSVSMATVWTVDEVLMEIGLRMKTNNRCVSAKSNTVTFANVLVGWLPAAMAHGVAAFDAAPR